MSQQAILLFAHGARDPEWARPLQRIQAAVRAQVGLSARVELAFLEFMSPTLGDTVDALVVDGITQIQILPMFIAQGGHLKRELPEMVEALRQRYPQLSISLSGAIGEQDDVIQAMAGAALRIAGLNLD